jgi:hypothetical protein
VKLGKALPYLFLLAGSVCRNGQTTFLNDFDLDLGFLRGIPLTFGEGALNKVSKDTKFKTTGGKNEDCYSIDRKYRRKLKNQ